MVRLPTDATNGVSVAVEIWRVSIRWCYYSITKRAPRIINRVVRLQDNSTVLGVLAEPALVVGMKDIRDFDGN